MALPFSVVVRPGRPLHDQIVFAVTKAVVDGQLRAGDPFPSVRALSQELRINPNTAQRIVTTLVERRLLETRQGIGTAVAEWRPATDPGHSARLASHLEQVVVEAKQLGLDVSDVLDAIRRAWTP